MPGRHRAERTSRGWLVPLLVLLLVLAAGGGTYLGLDLSAGSPARPAAAVTAPPSPVATLTPAITLSPTPPATTPPPAKPAPTLALRVIGAQCWVQVRTPAGQVLYAGTLTHGQRQVYRQPVLQLTVGDAGAIAVAIHGRLSSPAGAAGQVLNLVVR